MPDSVYIIMGVSGAGKTTIGELLSEQSGFPFYDGDDFHPAENVEKMQSGVALTNEDRITWIKALADHINQQPVGSQIIACSALNKTIRDLLLTSIERDCNFIFLKGEFKLIKQRLDSRQGHYMKSDLLRSQFEALEEPDDALVLDISLNPATICTKIRRHFNIAQA